MDKLTSFFGKDESFLKDYFYKKKTVDTLFGESGPKARPMQPEWVINIKRQVEQQGAAFFFKQWGTWGSDGVKRNKHANGKLLLGEVIQQMPGRKVV